MFVFATMYAFFKLVDVIVGNRVSAEVELAGLDLAEVGMLAYPEFTLSPGSIALARRKEAMAESRLFACHAAIPALNVGTHT